MRGFVGWFLRGAFRLGAIVAALAAMVLLHQRAMGDRAADAAALDELLGKQRALATLRTELESYRAESAGFRNLSSTQITSTKERLRSAFGTGLAQIEGTTGHQLSSQLAEMLTLSDRFERFLYSRNAYQRPEVQEIHRAMMVSIGRELDKTDARILELRSSAGAGTATRAKQSLVGMLAAAAVIVILWLAGALRDFFAFRRPLALLHRQALELCAGNPDGAVKKALSGQFGEIQNSLRDLASKVAFNLEERHKFILDVVADLKAPLSMIRAGKHLLGRAPTGPALEDPVEAQALESLSRGLAVLSGSLDDLSDLAEFNTVAVRAHESVIDLSEVVCGVARSLNGGILEGRQIAVSVPAMPLWTVMDGKRMERVLMRMIAKVAETMSRPGRIEVAVQQASSSFRGMEIVVREAGKDPAGATRPSGPQVDLLQHWISERGVSLALAKKFVESLGGAILAAGVQGSSATLTIRVPQERFQAVGLISPPRGLAGAGQDSEATRVVIGSNLNH